MPRYKHGKQTRPMEPQRFKEIMEKGKFVDKLRDKSFLAFLYWFGIRKSEILERVKSDFVIKNGLLIIDASPKKGGEREPLEISINYVYVDLIIEQIKRTRKTQKNPTGKVWNMSGVTAWKIVKRVLPKHYPHFFRLNRATKFLEDPETTIPEMMAWFGWKQIKTVSPYIGHSRRYIKKQRARLAKESEALK